MKTHKNLIYVICFMLFVNLAFAQRICDTKKHRISLSNGVSVEVFEESGTNTYYYVPNRLQISIEKGKKEYSFQEFNRGGTQGAILHCLVTWGLTKTQLSELRKLVKIKCGDTSTLAGAVNMQPSSNTIAFSNTELGNILKKSLKSQGSLPTFSNSKMALSFTITGNAVAVVKEAIKKPQNFKNTSISLNYTYDAYTCGKPINTKLKKHKIIIGQLKKWF